MLNKISSMQVTNRTLLNKCLKLIRNWEYINYQQVIRVCQISRSIGSIVELTSFLV